MFRIFVPGYGNVFVSAANQQAAITGALRFLESHNVTQKLNGADLDNLQAVPFSSGAVPQGATIVNSVGQDINTVSAGPTGTPPTGTEPKTPTSTAQPQGGISTATGTGPATGGGAGNPTGTVPAGAGTGNPSTLLERELADSGAASFRAYLQNHGLPTGGVLGNLLSGEAGPAFNTLQALNLFDAGLGKASPGSFQDFLSTSLGGGQGVIRGIGQQALSALQGLGRFEPGKNGEFSNADLQLALSPTSFRSDEAQGVVDTALTALAGRNPFLASNFSNQLRQELGKRFGNLAFQENQPSNFARFLQTQLGL